MSSDVTDGPAGAVPGTATAGTAIDGTATDGTATDGTATDGTATDGTTSDVTLADVLDVLGRTLGIEDRVGTFDAATPLFGTLPELDSLAVLELVTALEDRFAISVDDDELTGGMLETAGSLHAFVRDRAH